MPYEFLDSGGGGSRVPSPINLLARVPPADLPRAIRQLSPLPIDSQRLIDQSINEVGLDRLAVVADVIAEGLTYPLPNWMAVPHLLWQASSRSGTAQAGMMPRVRGENQKTDFKNFSLPVYCIWDDFNIDIRTAMVAERAGYPLDTTQIAAAARNVNELTEYNAINGAGFTVASNLQTYGLLNLPGAATYAFVSGKEWDDPNNTGISIVNDVIGMITKQQTTNKRYGPFTFYLPTLYSNALAQDYKDLGNITILQRLQAIDLGLSRPLKFVTADFVPYGKVICVSMQRECIDVVFGQEPTAITWSDPSGLGINSIVMACAILRPKVDYAGKTGIVIGAKS